VPRRTAVRGTGRKWDGALTRPVCQLALEQVKHLRAAKEGIPIMNRIAATLAAIVALAGAAWATEMEAVVKSYDPATKIVLLEDGTSYTVAEGIDVAMLETGAKLKLTIDDTTKQVTAATVVTVQ
jgi:hypothetical protein